MSFAGKFIVEKRENFDAFATAAGATPEQIAKAKAAKCELEVTRTGNQVTLKRSFPDETVTNNFTLGKSGEMTFFQGKNVQATVTEEGDKLIMKGDNFLVVAEKVDGKLKETLTLKGVTMVRWSKKL